MNKYLRKALEAVLLDAHASSVDNHGFLTYMDSSKVAVLVIEYEKEMRKHGKRAVRPSPVSV